MKKFLFDAAKINTLLLANRFIRSATWEGMAGDNGECTPRLTGLMAELARGRVGLIITGHAYVHQNGRHSPWQLGIDRDELIPGLQGMSQAGHDEGGKIAVQLGYGGAYLSKSRVRSLSLEDIQDAVMAYAKAAIRAKEAAFDAVQIFAAHGFLLSQFLCPRYNDRTDLYGGPIMNRARILLEVLAAVRKAVGPDYPVMAKMNCRDFAENGMTLQEAVQVGVMLEEAGIDAIELSGGLLNNPNIMRNNIKTEEDEAYFQDEAKAFKEAIHVPLILVGGIRSFAVASKLVEEGAADFISMSRPFICEPDLIRFFPQVSETVPASPPHSSNTRYRISIGLEQAAEGLSPVIKIQLERNGMVLEQAPYFPLDSDDYERVKATIAQMLVRQGQAG
jgi:2,4-dienoyl-CoA reductase-like NADH-dependent reductase (Old Yellow Enzyme family)